MSEKRSKYKFLIGIAVALLLPLSFYVVAKLLSKDRIHLPEYYVMEWIDTIQSGGKQVADTVFHKVNDLVLTNQLGQVVSLNKDLKGKMLVINFFFADCNTICPTLTKNIRILQKAFKKTPKIENPLDTVIQLISITVHPTNDSVTVIRNYANSYGVNHDHWWFLTGSKEAIANFARNELHVSIQPGEGADDLTHTEKVVLLDRDRYIRGYYNGLDPADMKRCADDIVLLTIEKKKHH